MRKSKCGVGICKLCEHERALKDSHIVPRFHKRNSRKTADSRGGLAVITDGKNEPDRMPTGRSECLLCECCEARLSRWEVCAANWFYNFTPEKLAEGDAGIVYSNIKYAEFRLYCLSVLWRMSVSNLPYYGRVRLDDSDSEVIRHALLAADTLEDVYPVGFSKITNLEGGEIAISVQPYRMEDEKHLSFHLLANGFMHDFWIRGYDKTTAIINASLKPDGLLHFPTFTYLEHPDIARVMQTHLDKNNG